MPPLESGGRERSRINPLSEDGYTRSGIESIPGGRASYLLIYSFPVRIPPMRGREDGSHHFLFSQLTVYVFNKHKNYLDTVYGDRGRTRSHSWTLTVRVHSFFIFSLAGRQKRGRLVLKVWFKGSPEPLESLFFVDRHKPDRKGQVFSSQFRIPVQGDR